MKPSMTALKVIVFLLVIKYLNPDDFGDELYVVRGRIDSPIFLDTAYHMLLSLGITNNFQELPDFVKCNLEEKSLQGIWLNLLNLDFRRSLSSGSPLIIPTFMGYDKTSSNKTLNHIGMMRKMCQRYCIFNGKTSGPLDDYLLNVNDRFATREECELDLLEITEYFKDNVKSDPKFWEDFKIRTMETSPEMDQRILRTLDVLDLTISLSFFLFESYDNTKDSVSDQDRIDLKNLSHQYMNNALYHASYIFKIIDWCLEQVLANEAVSKNRILQVVAYPVFKRVLMKLIMVCTSIIFKFSTMDNFGMVYKYDKEGVNYRNPRVSNIFDISLQEFDNSCFYDNVNNYQKFDYYTENFSIDFMAYWSKIYRCIKQIELLKKDIKWFVTFRELFFGIYYLIQNKRKNFANGKKGDDTKNCTVWEVFNLEQHLRLKKMYEDNIDPEHDYNRYTLKYILN